MKNTDAMKSIREFSISNLKDIIFNFAGNDIRWFNENKFREFYFIEELESSDYYLTFADIIMGIVPNELYQFINDEFKSNEITFRIISLWMHCVNEDFHRNIWLERCNEAILEEKRKGITKKDKKGKLKEKNSARQLVDRDKIYPRKFDIELEIKEKFFDYTNFNYKLGLGNVLN